ncbi:hypothetical protein [Actinoplanes sp. G11-F43]|uniref:hypothetical protein n=1 Tax=Actinoplanes sp. G11-F43 TaxID=3424130 RepID=UPI003D339F89
MSPGGTDASLLELVVGFFIAATVITVITMVVRRRNGSRDLLGAQVREMRSRAAAAASPDADTRGWDEAARIADARIADARIADPRIVDARIADPWIADPRIHEAAPRAPGPDGAPASDATAAPLDPGSPDVAVGSPPAQDPTAPPDGWQPVPGGTGDAMADAFTWLRIAALVEAGQREQAIELISSTMGVSMEEAGTLVDGLTDAGGEQRPA